MYRRSRRSLLLMKFAALNLHFTALLALGLGLVTHHLGRALAAEGPATPNPGLHYYYEVPKANPPLTVKVDLCVYGGTPAGIGAAVQAKRLGKTAALAVFRRHVGGLTSSGLTAVDLGKKESIGGMAKEFLSKMGKWSGFRSGDAEKVFRQMLKDAEVPVYYEHRLEKVEKDGNRITALVFENGNRIEAKMFVDATYEGDLFARAGVSFHVGREANAVYNETVNGYFVADKHQFRFPVDPYVKKGDPSSGLLPGINDGPPRETGSGDPWIQAYNFRMWLTRAEEGHPLPKPANYNRGDYALLERYITTRPDFDWDWKYRHGPVKLNLGDCNSAGPISTDFIGGSYRWPEADYAEREKIFQAHITYQQGMMWFLASDEAIPQHLRDFVKKFGLPKDQFEETGGWPHELYVREGRRMISDYVMTEHNCTGKVVAKDSVGLASYTMDSHHTSRVVVDGKVMAEGNVEKKTPAPYPVSYRSLVPKESECANLLIGVCVSSSHIAYGSIRMEPVFMILGQSAATAATMAIDANIPVQQVEYPKLRKALLEQGQILDWKPEATAKPKKPAKKETL